MLSGPQHLSALLSISRNRRASREDIIAFQNDRLRRLVAHAYKRVPYYRQLFDRARVKPHDIRGIEDLHLIPITERKELQRCSPEEIVAHGTDQRRLIVRMTGGSSGRPLAIRRSWVEERLLNLFRRRAMKGYGLRGFDRQAIVVSPRAINPNDNNFLQQLANAVGIYRRTRINCLLAQEEILRSLNEEKPSVLLGYAGSLTRIAQFVLATKHPLLFRPRFVICGGEVLTGKMRAQIGEAFSAPVFDVYGSHEFNLIAWECRKVGGYHTCDDNLIVEVIKDGRPVSPGERGEIVATALHSFTMPFIRYRLGDIVTRGPEKCPCGAPFSSIETIQGRMNDFFTLPSGRTLHPYQFTQPIRKNAPWVVGHQLIQERQDRFLLRIVASAEPTAEDVLGVRESVYSLLGREVELEIAVVDDLNLEKNGKFRIFRSLVDSEYNEVNWPAEGPDRSPTS